MSIDYGMQVTAVRNDHALVDRQLYDTALRIVKEYFTEYDGRFPTTRAQVKGMQEALSTLGCEEVLKMAQNRIKKSTTKENDRLFWNKVKTAIEGPQESSLKNLARALLSRCSQWGSMTDKEKKTGESCLVNELARFFFEHFCCEYYYRCKKSNP